MKEKLVALGFRYIGTCSCMGPKTSKYKKDQFTIYWGERIHKFKLKKFGRTITKTLPENEFDIIWQKETESALS